MHLIETPLPETLLEIAQAADGSDPAEAGRRLAQAAEAVEDFAEATALAALDGLLQAGALPDSGAAGAACRSIAEQLAGQTATLEAEVGRFLAHRRRIFSN